MHNWYDVTDHQSVGKTCITWRSTQCHSFNWSLVIVKKVLIINFQPSKTGQIVALVLCAESADLTRWRYRVSILLSAPSRRISTWLRYWRSFLYSTLCVCVGHCNIGLNHYICKIREFLYSKSKIELYKRDFWRTKNLTPKKKRAKRVIKTKFCRVFYTK